MGDPSRVRVTGAAAAVRAGVCGGAGPAGVQAERGGVPAAADGASEPLDGRRGSWAGGADAGGGRGVPGGPARRGLRHVAVAEGAGAAAGLSCGGWAWFRRLRLPRSTPAEALLGRYRRYLVTERGLAVVTARGYADMVRPFLAGREEAGGLDAGGADGGGGDGVRAGRLPGQAEGLGEADGDRAAVAAGLPARRRA